MPGELQGTGEEKSYAGIRGWLILPLVGLGIAPLQISFMLYRNMMPLFTKGYWEVLTTPGLETYHPLWAPLLMYEIAGRTGFLMFSLVLLGFFLRKSRRLPKLIIICLVLNLLFVAGDLFFSGMIPAIAEQEAAGEGGDLVRALVGVVIWVPYFMMSKRVKQTFVK